MSGTISGIQDLNNDDEWRTFMQGGKSALTSLSAAPAALTSLVVPDPKTGIPLTGLGSQVYNFADTVLHALTKTNPAVGVGVTPSQDETANLNEALLGKRAPEPVTSLKPYEGVGLPYTKEVGDAEHRVKELGKELLPPIPPTNEFERVGQGVVESAAGMGVPLPAALLGKLPAAARVAESFINPTGPVVRGLGGVIGGTEAIAHPAQEPLTFAQIMAPDAAPVDNTQLPVPPIPPAQPPEQGLRLADLTPQPNELDSIVHKEEQHTPTWGDLAVGLATVGAVVLGHKTLRATMGADIDAAAMARWESNTAYADHKAAMRAGTVGPGTPAPEVPLSPRVTSPLIPDALAQTSLKARNATIDSHAIVNDVNERYAPTQDMSDALRSQWGTSGNIQYVNERIKHIAETGHDSTSGVSMPSLKDQATRISTWDDATKKAYNDAVYSANELDNRTKLFTPGQQAPRVQFSDYSDAQLRKFVADGYADPNVAFELHQNQVHNVRMTELMQGRGLIDSTEAAKFIRDHPNYLPTADVRGIIDNPFKARDLTEHSGINSAYVPAWELKKQHFEAVIKEAEQNIPITNTVRNILDGQTSNPRAPKLVELLTEPKQDGSTIAFRENGQLRYAQINNSGLRLAMQQPAATQSLLIDAASKVSALARSGTTQAIAATMGSPFALKNALRMTSRMGIAHAPDTYTGYLDRALQQLNPKLGLPGGADPTMYLAPFIGTVQNAYGMQAKAISEMLRGGASNPFNSVLRRALGDAAVDALSARVGVAYNRSIRGMMHEQGGANSTGLAAVETPTSQFGAREKVASPLNATVPELYMNYGKLAAPNVVRLNNLFSELLNMVGESTHTFYYGLNRNNPALIAKHGVEGAERMNVFNTRQLGGDVGQHGANSLVRDYSAISKYTNVMLQDWANLTDAMAARPFQTTLNYITTMGIPAAASIYTAMLHGPDAINHLFNELSSDQKSAQFHFYVPGQPPENSPTIPVSQTDRFAIAPLLQMMFDIGNLQSHDPTDATWQWMQNGLEDLFSKHITEGTIQGAEAGLKSATEIPTPDALNAGFAVAGQRPIINPVDLVAGKGPLGDRLHRPLGGDDPNLPGVAQEKDPNGDAVTASTWRNVMGAVLGAAGSAAHQSFQAARANYALHKDPVEALSTIADTFGNRLKQSVPVARGILWDAPEKLSMASPLAVSVREGINSLRPLIPVKSDIKNEGFTRTHGTPIEAGPLSQAKLPEDPTMLQAYIVAGRMASKMLGGKHSPEKEVSDFSKLIGVIPNSGKPEAQKLAEHNDLVRQRQLSLERAADMITDINTAVSRVIGKQVDVRKVDWHKGPEQFK